MKKPNLILVHSFPTNSILLNGLVEFLKDYFKVIFIDLPGFNKNNPAFKGDITLKKFSNYLDQRIKELNISEYFVAGVSFGFLVVNNAKLDKRCRGILAIEPFLGTKYLKIPPWKQKEYLAFTGILGLIRISKLENKIWSSELFKEYIKKESGYPKGRIETILKYIEPRTFFAVLELLMNYNMNLKFHDLPYFLMGNFADKTINFSSVAEIFIKNLHKLYIMSEPIDHYPKNPTKEYFKKHISRKDISNLVSFMKL